MKTCPLYTNFIQTNGISGEKFMLIYHANASSKRFTETFLFYRAELKNICTQFVF